MAVALRVGTPVLLQGHPPTDPTSTGGTITVHLLRAGGQAGTQLAEVPVLWTPRPAPTTEQIEAREFGTGVTGVDGGPVLLSFGSGFPHAGVVEHPTGVVLRVPGRPDRERVGLAYDPGSGEAVAFDPDTHAVIGRRLVPPPPSAPVYPLSPDGTVMLPNQQGQEETYIVGRPPPGVDAVEAVADFGSRTVSFVGAGTDQRIGPSRPFPGYWPDFAFWRLQATPANA